MQAAPKWGVVGEVLALSTAPGGKRSAAQEEENNGGRKQGDRPGASGIQQCPRHGHAHHAGHGAYSVGQAQQHGRMPRGQVCMIAVQPRQGEAGQAQCSSD